MKFLSKKHLFCIFLGLVFFTFAHADFSSTSYTMENPVNIIEGGQSSSSSFQYLSSTGQLTSGQSTSTSFAENAGFLYFPTASTPALSATAGNAQVALSWTAATGILANVTSYQVGTGTVSGTYTFQDVGNVISYTKTGLSNGTPYYFKVRSYALGLLLSESVEVSSTPVAPSTPPSSGGSGGGGGGGSGGGGSITVVSDTGVNFSGRAYPLSKISILKDGQLALTTIAGPDSKFNATLGNLSTGDYTFSVYGTDKNGVRSSPFTFPVFITAGSTTNIGGIFIAPTISVDKSEVKKGDNIAIFGQSTPSSQVVISVHSQQELFKNTESDADGVYLHNLDTSPLEMGSHVTKSKALVGGEISSFGDTVSFVVGTKNVPVQVSKSCSTKGDVNGDCKINLVDFSVAAYWYKKKNPPAKVDLNNDNAVNLIDFSIMAYYWTG